MLYRIRNIGLLVTFVVTVSSLVLSACQTSSPGDVMPASSDIDIESSVEITARELEPTAESYSNPIVPLIEFPGDEGSHESAWEWWYFNGHLETEDKREYSYHFVFFEVFIEPLKTYALAGHGSITNREEGTYEFAQRLGSRDVSPKGELQIDTDGWVMNGGDGAFILDMTIGESALRLELEAVKPAVLHGGNGYVEYSDLGGSYYYSYPRINSYGIVIDNGIERKVTGLSWMDHQWGDAILSELGWDWFNLQLNDGTELMYYKLRDGQGKTIHQFGTVIDDQGRPREIDPESLSVEPLGVWESETSRSIYPSGWRLEMDQDISLNITPVVEESEFYIPGSFLPVYWEGAVVASAHGLNGAEKGRGFVELVGYIPP